MYQGRSISAPTKSLCCLPPQPPATSHRYIRLFGLTAYDYINQINRSKVKNLDSRGIHPLSNLLDFLERPSRKVPLMSPHIHSCFLCGYTIGDHDGPDSWEDMFRIREVSSNSSLVSANRSQSIQTKSKSQSRGSALLVIPELFTW